MTLKQALVSTISNAIEDLQTAARNLLSTRYTGQGGQLWAEFRKLFLSGREEESDYYLADADPSVGILDIEKITLPIHMQRGTPLGIVGDTKRICNSSNVSLTKYTASQCGWILDVTAPDFDSEGKYDPLNSLCQLDLASVTILKAQNSGNRTDDEVIDIIEEEFIPVMKNVRLNISRNPGFGEGAFGEGAFG